MPGRWSLFQPGMSRGTSWTGHKSITGVAQRQTPLTPTVTLPSSVYRIGMSLGCGRKLDYLERTSEQKGQPEDLNTLFIIVKNCKKKEEEIKKF